MIRRLLITILLLALTVLMTAGCLNINIRLGIDERYTSYLVYEISMDVSDVDPQYHSILSAALNNFGWNYQQLYGFNVGINLDTDVYSLNMRKSEANDTFSEAFESLRSMLTDENISAFMSVDMNMETFVQAESYAAGAMLDIPHIINMSNIQDMPPDIQDEFYRGLDGLAGTIEMTIPATEVYSGSHDYEHTYRTVKMQIPVSMNEQASFEIRGTVIYADDDMTMETFEEIAGNHLQLRTMILFAGAGILILLLIIMISVLIRIRRHNKLFDQSL